MENRDIFVFFGPPGAGKGSLSQLIVDNLGWSQFSTGNACRKHIAEQTEIGKNIDFAIKSGKLVSDELVVAMVEDWLDHEAPKDENLILDGCPRTVPQAKYLQTLIENKYPNSNIRIINLSASDNVLINRVLDRIVCSNKKCQAVYSFAKNSQQSPKQIDICDICGSKLVRRSDDTKEAIVERLAVYKQHANAVLDYFDSIGKKVEILDAEKPLEVVFSEFKEKILRK